MKKAITLVAAIALVLSIMLCTGCGSSKQQEAIDVFNKTSTAFDEVAALINKDLEAVDAKIVTEFNETATLLTEYKTKLESDEKFSDSEYDEMIKKFNEIKARVDEVKAMLNKDASGNNSSGDNTQSTNTNVFPEALTNVDAYPVNDIEDTIWQFAGGMINGVEMEEADLNAIYEAMGGIFNFYFVDDKNIIMANGEQSFNGTYTVAAENYIIDATFEGYAYYGVFTVVDEVPVLIMVNKADSEKAFYFYMIEEG